MSRSVWPWVLAGVLAGACVEVPDRQDALDAGPDGPAMTPVSDGRPPDAAGPADAGPDVLSPVDADAPDAAAMTDAGPGPDAALPPRDDCLPPIDGPYTPDLPCLTVRAIADPDTELVEAAGLVVPGPTGPLLRINGGLDREATPAVGRTAGWLYDPAADRWSPDPRPLPEPRWGHQMAEMANGEAVVAGGAATLEVDGAWVALGPVLFDNPLDQQWLEGGSPLTPPRSEGVLLRANALTVAYLGGVSSPRDAPANAVDAMVVPATVVPNEGMQIGRHALAAIALSDESVLVVGGLNEAGVAETRVERLGGPGSAVRDLPDAPEPRAWAGAASLPDGALFVGGRAAEGAPPRPEAFRFETAINRFVEVDDLHLGRARPTVTAIGPGGAGWRLVVGGAVAREAEPGIVELYDPRTDTFHAFRLPSPWDRHRAGHVAAGLIDEGADDAPSTVIVVGGYDPLLDRSDPRNTRPSLAFDLDVTHLPPHGPSDCLPIVRAHGDRRPCLRLTRGPALSGARHRAAAVTDGNGRVVISGGRDAQSGEPLDTVETLTLGARRWRPGPPLLIPRFAHAAVGVGDVDPARVVVAGGVDRNVEFGGQREMLATATIEIWAPDTGGWALADDGLSAPRMDFALMRTLTGGFVSGGRSGTAGAVSATVDVLAAGRVQRHFVDLPQGRSRHTMCAYDDQLIIAGGLVGDAAADDIVALGLGNAGVEVLPVDPLIGVDMGCIGPTRGLAGAVDFFGGRPDATGAPASAWTRFVRDPAPQLIQLPDLGQGRARMTINRIGPGEAGGAAWLIVGGEMPGADPTVEMVFANRAAAEVEIYSFALPDGVPIRYRHAAVTRSWVGTLVDGEPVLERDVVVMGGTDLDRLEPLDEVLIFTYEAFAIAPGVGE